MADTNSLPTDLEVLDAARGQLSAARDWLASDTADAIAGDRSMETASLIHDVVLLVGQAKVAIDIAKESVRMPAGGAAARATRMAALR